MTNQMCATCAHMQQTIKLPRGSELKELIVTCEKGRAPIWLFSGEACQDYQPKQSEKPVEVIESFTVFLQKQQLCIGKLQARNDQLERTIEQLIEAGRALTAVAEWRYTILPELLAWDTLVDNVYKEREK